VHCDFAVLLWQAGSGTRRLGKRPAKVADPLDDSESNLPTLAVSGILQGPGLFHKSFLWLALHLRRIFWRADCYCSPAKRTRSSSFGRLVSPRGPTILPPTVYSLKEFRRHGMAKKQKDSKSSETSIQIQPIGDRVVVEREESESVTAGGIVLPDIAKDKPTRGKIISVGDGRPKKDGTRTPLQVKVGDRVLFTSYAGEQFKLGDRELLLMHEEDILAVFE
jgi:chaperonin GroES